MKDRPTAWVDQIRPLPGGWILRSLIVAGFALIIWSDIAHEHTDLATLDGWLKLVVPSLPLLALLAGALPATITWFAVLAVALVWGAPTGVVASMLVPTLVSIALCTFLLPWKQAVMVGVAAPALAIGSQVLTPESFIDAKIALCSTAALGAAAGLSLNRYRRRNDQSTDLIRALEEKQAQVRSEERARLAHELHDIVAHDVTIIAMQARRAEFVDDPAKTAKILEDIGSAAQQALRDLRSLVTLLKTKTVEAGELLETAAVSGETTTAAGFVQDVSGVVAALERAGFVVNLRVEGEASRIPASLRQALRRTVRELGTNALKHADPAGIVELSLTVEESRVALSSTNRISSVAPVMSSRTGLEAMRARCEVFGGSLDAGPSRGSWTTTISVPLDRGLVSTIPEEGQI